jgi:hypothetical protein
MTEQLEWTIEGRDVFIDRWGDNGLETMTREEAEARLNEYETLKKATEMWTPDDARRLSSTCMSMQGKAIHGKGYPSLRESAIAYWKSRVVKLLAYADILEEK